MLPLELKCQRNYWEGVRFTQTGSGANGLGRGQRHMWGCRYSHYVFKEQRGRAGEATGGPPRGCLRGQGSLLS